MPEQKHPDSERMDYLVRFRERYKFEHDGDEPVFRFRDGRTVRGSIDADMKKNDRNDDA